MIWFIMRVIAYGFEAIIIAIMTLIFIGIIKEKKPEWLDRIFNLVVINDDDI